MLLTSISFILGVGRLAKKRALVQEMEAIEALARVNVLCLDKTGTITTGELEVTEVLGLGEVKKEEVSEIMNELTFAFEDSNNTQEALKRYFRERNSRMPIGMIRILITAMIRLIVFCISEVARFFVLAFLVSSAA